MVEKSAHRVSVNRLSNNPDLPRQVSSRLEDDFDRFAGIGLPAPLEPYLADVYGLDVATVYAGLPIKNPWGKGSGQLSMTEQQVEEDAAAGLGFCVLKTVIAQDSAGVQAMKAWAIPESKMVLERIRGNSGEEGWTVSWKGRGWHRGFDDYLSLVSAARRIAEAAGMLVAPSCKFHLPATSESAWKTDEYEFTTKRLIESYQAENACRLSPMPLEKDFSPTLAGSNLSNEQSQILDWLRTIPRLIRSAAGTEPIRVGLKMFNALFCDEFQLRMLQSVATAGVDRPDYVVYANRLFDPAREFDGQRGIAVGGPDLSDRNLRILRNFQAWLNQASPAIKPLEISATGNICSGKKAVEYLLAGCSSFQLHTFFQLPADQYHMKQGSRTAKALHMLYFHPQDGFIAWMLHVADRLGVRQKGEVRFQNLVGLASPP